MGQLDSGIVECLQTKETETDLAVRFIQKGLMPLQTSHPKYECIHIHVRVVGITTKQYKSNH